MNEHSDTKRTKKAQYEGAAIAIGAGMGSALGVAFGLVVESPALGSGTGTAIGAMVGTFVEMYRGAE